MMLDVKIFLSRLALLNHHNVLHKENIFACCKCARLFIQNKKKCIFCLDSRLSL
jgi:hypothetical protein